MAEPRLNYKNYSVLEILNMIADCSSTNGKIEIMKQARINKDFIETLKMAYNPNIKYSVNDFEVFDKLLPDWSQSMTLQRIYNTTLKVISGGTLTEERAKHKLYMATMNMTEEQVEVLKRVVNKDLKIGCGIKMINKAIPNLIEE